MTEPKESRSRTLNLRLRPEEAEQLRRLAERADEPVSAVVRRAIRDYLASQKKARR